MLPSLPNLFQPAHNIGRQAYLTIRRSIQNQIAMSAIQRLKPLVHHSCHRLEMAVDVLLFPEPPVRKCHTRQSWYIAALRDLLSGILLKRLHVGIVESARRILAGVEVADQAIGLQVLDVVIDLAERYLFIRDTAPWRVPAI